MPETIEYTDYRRDLAKDASRPIAEASDAPMGYVGLSSYNIPQEIRFQVGPKGAVRMLFFYSDGERPEKATRSLEGYTGVRLALGRETKKIMAIEVDDPEHFFTKRDNQITLGVHRFLGEFSRRDQRILILNAEVVTEIVAEMPKRLRATILEASRQRRRQERMKR